MEAQKEAQRIMTMSVWKLYHSRLQRGGLRLHRSLQLSLVMRSARELYLSAKLEEAEAGAGESAVPDLPPPPPEERAAPADCAAAPGATEPMETQESGGEPALAPASPGKRPARGVSVPAAGKGSRKRRSSSLDKPGAAEAGLAPSKKARLEEEAEAEAEGERQPQGQDGPFPSLATVLQHQFAGRLRGGPAKGPAPPTPGCRPGDGAVLNILVRAVVAF